MVNGRSLSWTITLKEINTRKKAHTESKLNTNLSRAARKLSKFNSDHYNSLAQYRMSAFPKTNMDLHFLFGF